MNGAHGFCYESPVHHLPIISLLFERADMEKEGKSGSGEETHWPCTSTHLSDISCSEIIKDRKKRIKKNIA